jgi:hypothetical protein
MNRKERIILLLESLKDVQDDSQSFLSDKITSGTSYSFPRRSNLFRQGSYKALEKALDLMRDNRTRRHDSRNTWYRALVKQYINREATDAEKGLNYLSSLLPKDIYVPEDVALSAGYSPSEAKQMARPRK